jgi:replicative DNA helicase
MLDHVRKLRTEQGLTTMKQLIDKWSGYSVDLRNKTKYTFVNIVHTNRELSSVSRQQFVKGDLYPTLDDIKDSGNLAEDSDFVITMMNPHDDAYNIKKGDGLHFGVHVEDYPALRSLHLVASRYGNAPEHFPVLMKGNLKAFNTIN